MDACRGRSSRQPRRRPCPDLLQSKFCRAPTMPPEQRSDHEPRTGADSTPPPPHPRQIVRGSQQNRLSESLHHQDRRQGRATTPPCVSRGGMPRSALRRKPTPQTWLPAWQCRRTFAAAAPRAPDASMPDMFLLSISDPLDGPIQNRHSLPLVSGAVVQRVASSARRGCGLARGFEASFVARQTASVKARTFLSSIADSARLISAMRGFEMPVRLLPCCRTPPTPGKPASRHCVRRLNQCAVIAHDAAARVLGVCQPGVRCISR